MCLFAFFGVDYLQIHHYIVECSKKLNRNWDRAV